MLEGKQAVFCDGTEFCVILQVKAHLSRIRYTQEYDLLTAAKHYMTEEEAEARNIDPLSIASIVSPYVMEDTPKLTKAEKTERKNAFCAACFAVATEEGMDIIVRAADKKKNGTLMKNRIVHIATLQMVNQRANTWELFAKAMDDINLEIGIRKIVCKASEIDRIQGHINGQQDLAVINEDFKKLCTEMRNDL